MRSHPCGTCGGVIFAKSRSGPIPKHHAECWRIQRGGCASGEYQRKLREKGKCVDCHKNVGERNPRTGKKRSRCVGCAEIRKTAYRELSNQLP